MNKSIAITETYLSSVFKLDTDSRKHTLNTIKQLSDNPQSASLQIHSINRTKCDLKFRSARVNDNLRVIFVAQGDIYTLLYVDHHDDAYDWCEGKFLKKTDFGAQYIYDEKIMLTTNEVSVTSDYLRMNFETPLLAKVDIREKHLIKLGIPEIHAKNLLAITTEDIFIDYIAIFPAEISEALLDLATRTKSFDIVLDELNDDSFDVSSEDIISHKDNKRRFYVPESINELELLMGNDSFEKWTLFLHPSQEKLVKKNFTGPVLIEGGPGTGKTIVGIHRAVYLSQNIYKEEDKKRILFCTFSKKLAKVISTKIEVLMKQKGIKNNIDVVSVDSFIYNVLKDAYGTPKPVNPSALDSQLNKLYDELKPKGTKSFYEYEYNEVVVKNNIKTLNEYLKVDRIGTGMPLDKNMRTIIWKFIEKMLVLKEQNSIITFVDRAYSLYSGFLNKEIIPKYDSIIIDEAQDLEPIKLKSLCKCVRTAENNIIILSDMNQRIFKLSTWKNDIDINVVGRTHYLSINYRTTKQINDYARYQFINSEMINSHIKEYKSIVNGVDPLVVGFTTESGQYKYVVNKISEQLNSGRLPNQICIVAPTKGDCRQIESVLTFADIKSTLLFDEIAPTCDSGVCICPIQGVKGLEFEVVVIYNYNNIGKGRLEYTDSPTVKINYNKLIECEKYVAATRARDELIVTYMEAGDL